MTKPGLTRLILPDNCFSHQGEFSPLGVLVHFISAKNIDSERRYDRDLILGIFKQYRVSAHFMIERNGTILQLVPLHAKAWHAGKSKFRNLTGLNNSFLGIEMVGDDENAFTDSQYLALAKLISWLTDQFGISTDWVRGHQEVSDSRVRKDPKTDPGYYFDWLRVGMLLNVLRMEDEYVGL